MIPDTSWTPEPSDIVWQRELIRLLKIEAEWEVPASRSVFEINKRRKTFILTKGNPRDETNRRIAKVFRFLGFTEQAPDAKYPIDRLHPSQN
jgi:hypothetical protein